MADHIRGNVEVGWKSPRQGKTVNCAKWSGRTASCRLLVCKCRWSADLGGGCQFEPFGYWSHFGAGVWGLRQWRQCITSDEPGSPYTTVTVGSGCAVGKGRGWLMPVGSLKMEIMVCQSWYGVQSTRGGGGGGGGELVVVDGAINRHRYIQILRNKIFPWATRMFGRKFVNVQDNTPPHTASDTAAFFTNRMLRSCTGQLGVHTWTQLSMFGIKFQHGSETP